MDCGCQQRKAIMFDTGGIGRPEVCILAGVAAVLIAAWIIK